MKQHGKVLLIAMMAIVLLDGLGAIASRLFDFNGALLSPISFILYGVFGYIGSKIKNLNTGVIYSAAIGLFDSTVGWKISMILKANTGSADNNPTLQEWTITIIVVTSIAALLGLIGGSLFKQRIKKHRNDLNIS
jgi:hypothetical protein